MHAHTKGPTKRYWKNIEALTASSELANKVKQQRHRCHRCSYRRIPIHTKTTWYNLIQHDNMIQKIYKNIQDIFDRSIISLRSLLRKWLHPSQAERVPKLWVDSLSCVYFWTCSQKATNEHIKWIKWLKASKWATFQQFSMNIRASLFQGANDSTWLSHSTCCHWHLVPGRVHLSWSWVQSMVKKEQEWESEDILGRRTWGPLGKIRKRDQ